MFTFYVTGEWVILSQIDADLIKSNLRAMYGRGEVCAFCYF